MNETLQIALFWGTLLSLGLLEWILDPPELNAKRFARWPVNLAFGISNAIIFTATPFTTFLMALYAQEKGFGLFNQTDTALWVHLVVTLLVLTFVQYWYHRISHRSPWLWMVHETHHTDQHIDVSSAFRDHPLDVVGSLTVNLPLVLLFGFDPVVIAALSLVVMVADLLSHTSLQLPHRLDQRLAWVLITPAMHRKHHSIDVAEANSNYGVLISIWDHAFGTFSMPGQPRPEVYGLDYMKDKETNDLGWLVVLPFVRLTKRLRAARAPARDRSETPS